MIRWVPSLFESAPALLATWLLMCEHYLRRVSILIDAPRAACYFAKFGVAEPGFVRANHLGAGEAADCEGCGEFQDSLSPLSFAQAGTLVEE